MPDGITTDQLNIVIKVDSSKATEGIDEVKKALEELGTISAKSDISKLSEIARSFSDLGTAFRSLGSTDLASVASNITSVYDALTSVDTMKLASGVSATAAAFERLTAPVSAFLQHSNGLSAAAAGLGQLNKSLANFENGPDMENADEIRESMYQLGQSVSAVGTVGNNVNQLKNGIKGLSKAVEEFSVSDRDIAKIGPVVGALSRLMEQFSESGAKGAEAFYKVAAAFRTLNEQGFTAGLRDNIQNAVKAIQEFIDKVNTIPTEAVDRVIRLGEAIKNLTHIRAASRAMNSYARSLNSAKRASQESHSSHKKLVKTLKKIGSVLVPIKAVSKGIKSLGKALGSLGGKALDTMFVSPFKRATGLIGKFGGAFKKLGHTIGRLVLYRLLRSMIRMITQQVKLGIDALYNWSDVVGYRFKAAMDGLATSFQYLRNSVAAMISPIVEGLQPVIDSLVDRIVDFLNVVNQFIAVMSGKDTWVRAIKGAAEYAEETDYAAAAQDRLNRTILGFDELNKLDDTKDRNSGSPTANAGGGEFEELPISESFKNMTVDFGDLGQKLSDGLADALSKINWNRIQKNVNKAAGKVVDFFNGFFGNDEAWEETGKTVGNAVNTLTGAVLTFKDGVEWDKIGRGLAGGFKSAIRTVNWTNFGKSIASTTKMLSKLFSGFVNSMTKTDWAVLGTGIGTAINTAINEIPWEDYIPDLFSFASGMFTALISALSQIKFSELADRIAKGFENADWKNAISNMGTTLKNFIINALNSINWENVKTTVNDVVSTIAGLIDDFLGDKNTWSAVATTISGAANTIISGVLTFTGSIDWENLGGNIADAVKKAADTINWTDLGKAIASVAKVFTNLIHGFVTGTTTDDWKNIGHGIGEAISGAINDINWVEFTLDLATLALGLVDALIGALETLNLKTLIGNIFSESSWESLKGFFATLAGVLYDIAAFIRPAVDVFSSKKFMEGYDAALDKLYALSGKGKQAAQASQEFSSSISDAFSDMFGNESAPQQEMPGSDYFKEFDLDADSWGSDLIGSLAAGIREKLPTLKGAVEETTDTIEEKLDSSNDKSPLYPWTWGKDFAQSFASGLQSTGAINSVITAAANVAASAKQYLAFSKPDKGPLSDADTYGPDFMKLFAQGIENSKYLVENAVRGVSMDASDVMGSMTASYTLNNEPTGLDSLAQAIMNSDTPINVYIGNDKLDTVIARSNSRLNYRSGGKY